MAADMSAIKTSIESIVGTVRELASPRPTNWIAIGTLIVSLAIGVSQYVDLRLVPGLEQQRRIYEHLEVVEGQVDAQQAGIARLETESDWLRYQLRHSDTLRHKGEDRLTELESRAAAAEVSRKATGDYLRQVDELGSRRWQQESAPVHATKTE